MQILSFFYPFLGVDYGYEKLMQLPSALDFELTDIFGVAWRPRAGTSTDKTLPEMNWGLHGGRGPAGFFFRQSQRS